jgi:hypothetical protein
MGFCSIALLILGPPRLETAPKHPPPLQRNIFFCPSPLKPINQYFLLKQQIKTEYCLGFPRYNNTKDWFLNANQI